MNKMEYTSPRVTCCSIELEEGFASGSISGNTHIQDVNDDMFVEYDEVQETRTFDTGTGQWN